MLHVFSMDQYIYAHRMLLDTLSTCYSLVEASVIAMIEFYDDFTLLVDEVLEVIDKGVRTTNQLNIVLKYVFHFFFQASQRYLY